MSIYLDYIYEHNNEHNISIVGFEIRFITKANVKYTNWDKIRHKKHIFKDFKHALIIGNIGGDELLTYHYFKMKTHSNTHFRKRNAKMFRKSRQLETHSSIISLTLIHTFHILLLNYFTTHSITAYPTTTLLNTHRITHHITTHLITHLFIHPITTLLNTIKST